MDTYIEIKSGGNQGQIIDLLEVAALTWSGAFTEGDPWGLTCRIKGSDESVYIQCSKEEALKFVDMWKETRKRSL